MSRRPPQGTTMNPIGKRREAIEKFYLKYNPIHCCGNCAYYILGKCEYRKYGQCREEQDGCDSFASAKTSSIAKEDRIATIHHKIRLAKDEIISINKKILIWQARSELSFTSEGTRRYYISQIRKLRDEEKSRISTIIQLEGLI